MRRVRGQRGLVPEDQSEDGIHGSGRQREAICSAAWGQAIARRIRVGAAGCTADSLDESRGRVKCCPAFLRGNRCRSCGTGVERRIWCLQVEVDRLGYQSGRLVCCLLRTGWGNSAIVGQQNGKGRWPAAGHLLWITSSSDSILRATQNEFPEIGSSGTYPAPARFGRGRAPDGVISCT